MITTMCNFETCSNTCLEFRNQSSISSQENHGNSHIVCFLHSSILYGTRLDSYVVRRAMIS